MIENIRRVAVKHYSENIVLLVMVTIIMILVYSLAYAIG